MENVLARLSRWQEARCDGEHEHRYGITITSTDNPGWWVKIDLAGTELTGKPFEEVAEGVGVARHPQLDSWLCCHVVGGVWHGAGDLTRLEEILIRFLDWAGA